MTEVEALVEIAGAIHYLSIAVCSVVGAIIGAALAREWNK